MLRFMLDTDICIYVMKERSGPLRERFRQGAGAMCVSAITLAELFFGAEKSERRDHNLRILSEFFSRLDTLEFGAKAASHFGQLRAELERLGKPAGAYDMLIGAHARSEGLIVVANNRREFDRMPGLRVENWI
jgi:tRNA(fMet)-specific endonuclease VapC